MHIIPWVWLLALNLFQGSLESFTWKSTLQISFGVWDELSVKEISFFLELIRHFVLTYMGIAS